MSHTDNEEIEVMKEIDTDLDAAIELEVERRLEIREREIRERNSERAMKMASLTMYCVLAFLLFSISIQLWPEITRIAIIVIGCSVVTVVLVLIISNFCRSKRTSGKAGWHLLRAVLGVTAIALPLVITPIGTTYWPDETKEVLIAIAGIMTLFLVALLCREPFEKWRSARGSKQVPNANS